MVFDAVDVVKLGIPKGEDVKTEVKVEAKVKKLKSENRKVKIVNCKPWTAGYNLRAACY